MDLHTWIKLSDEYITVNFPKENLLLHSFKQPENLHPKVTK